MAVLGLYYRVWAFSSCGQWGLLSSCGAGASYGAGFSCCPSSSRVQAQQCGAQA